MKLNEKGQVLLIVVLVSAISLIITFSIVARVSRLTRTIRETEQHEAAFAVAEEYSRKILDEIERGEAADPETIIANVGETEEVEIEYKPVSRVDGISIQNEMTYEVNPNAVAGKLGIISSLSNSNVKILVSMIGYNPANSEYSVQKHLWGSSCANLDGDNIANLECIFDPGTPNRISVSFSVNENVQSVRLRSIEGNQEISIEGQADNASQILALANEYVVTATKKFGEISDAVKSETKLTIPSGKSMHSLFDYVLFNSEGTIEK